jgi:hypothetical protein
MWRFLFLFFYIALYWPLCERQYGKDVGVLGAARSWNCRYSKA